MLRSAMEIRLISSLRIVCRGEQGRKGRFAVEEG